MSTTNVVDEKGRVPHIGAAHHPARTLAWIAMAVAIAAMLGVYLFYEHRHAATTLGDLDRFDSVYGERCATRDASPEADALRRKLYLGSPLQQRAVATQLVALQGGASCDAVWQAIHDTDLSIATPPIAATP